MTYNLLKIVHILSVLIWISGMFRLLDFHQHKKERESQREAVLEFDSTWTSPAMLSAWCAGIAMAYLARWWNHSWFLWKVLLVVALSGLHGLLIGTLDREDGSANQHAKVWWLIPLLLGIVSLVVIKP